MVILRERHNLSAASRLFTHHLCYFPISFSPTNTDADALSYTVVATLNFGHTNKYVCAPNRCFHTHTITHLESHTLSEI